MSQLTRGGRPNPTRGTKVYQARTEIQKILFFLVKLAGHPETTNYPVDTHVLNVITIYTQGYRSFHKVSHPQTAVIEEGGLIRIVQTNVKV